MPPRKTAARPRPTKVRNPPPGIVSPQDAAAELVSTNGGPSKQSIRKMVDAYLTVLQTRNTPRRGRRSNPETLREKLAVIDEEIAHAVGVERLRLLRDQRVLQGKLDAFDTDSRFDELEQQFIRHALDFAQRSEISYDDFRTYGVSAEVLQQAGFSSRSRG